MIGARWALGVGLLVGTLAGCLLPGQQGGTPCETDDDCPVFFICEDREGTGQLACEPERIEGGGELPGADAGDGQMTPEHFFCTDVKPVLLRNCVQACHGEQTIGSGNPGFRFDIYADEGGKKGSYAMRDRIKARAIDLKTMPPPGTGDMTDEERQLLAEWISQGAPYCNDGSMPGGNSDAGGDTTDGGSQTTDAGMETDAGSPPADAGVQVSFANDVHPILENRCVSCHGASDPNVKFDTSTNSYTTLVNKASACDGAVVNVKPGDTQGSMLWRKLSNAADKCGGVMPVGGALKTTQPAEFAIIEAWIEQGAKNN